MVKKNPDAAVVATVAVVFIVLLHGKSVYIEPTHTPTTEPATAVIATTQTAHIPEESTEPTVPPTILYDVPLDIALQLHIIQVAESYGIDPAIIFAMCYRESSYNPASIGDQGAAFGLMQIQPRWHSDRMARLGCTNLLDPFQNVTVGIDYLAEQMDRYGGDIRKALVAYNAGHYKGTITRYAQEVLAKAEELRATTYIYTLYIYDKEGGA